MNSWRSVRAQRRSVFVAVTFLAALTGQAAYAQDRPFTPRRGTAMRAAIMDALRAPVQRRIGRRVIFKVSKLRVYRGWAFIEAEPRAPSGAAMNWRGTRYEEAWRSGAFGGLVHGLLRYQGRWRVVTMVIGASDVPYVGWWRQYGAPRTIFPYTE
jgi:hypothetical protein